jgi:uncharacterized protein
VSVTLLLAGLVVLVGATVQGFVGFGLGLFAAPLLALLDPTLVPVPLLLVATVTSVLSVLREHRHTDWRGVGWMVLGRVPGTFVGLAAVLLLSARWFGILVGLSVLACVALSLVSWHPRPTRPTLLLAGAVSGATATSATIGGPPVAIVYQHSEGPRVRATLGAFFVLGAAMSVAALASAGRVGLAELRTAGLLVPFLLVGFALSGPARRWVDVRWLRPLLLGVSSAGAVLLIAQAVQ